MPEDVVPDAVGDGDDPLTPAHDGGVPVDGVEAVHAGDQAGPVFRRQFFPGQVAGPGRHAGMEVEDVRPDGLQKSAERPYAKEGGEAFFADRHQDMAGTFLFQLFYHASSAGNDDVFHTLGGESPAEFQNDLFHASGFHGGDEMHYFHKVASWGKSLERM